QRRWLRNSEPLCRPTCATGTGAGPHGLVGGSGTRYGPPVLGLVGSASGEGGGMFGKSVGEYLGFQKVVLAVIFVVWLVRLVLSIFTGRDNIYTAPEYSGGGDGKNWLHVVAHLVVAAVVLPLIGWGVSSLVMLVTKKVAPRPA